MRLTYHQTTTGPRWALNNQFLPGSFSLTMLLDIPAHLQADLLNAVVTRESAAGGLLAPIEPNQEVWASGVTFLRSRVAREAESATGDIYQKVYLADRPELFYKSTGWRVAGPGEEIRTRRDSQWNVPEPELVLLLNRLGEICGYTAGNDVSSRDIEGQNPLYLPQAKVYNGSCALGPEIIFTNDPADLVDLPIRLEIRRSRSTLFAEQTSTRQMKRSFSDLAAYLFSELTFPSGVFLMTGTGIVPPDTFSLQPNDEVKVMVGDLSLHNITRR